MVHYKVCPIGIGLQMVVLVKIVMAGQTDCTTMPDVDPNGSATMVDFDTVYYECNTGFQLIGESVLQCDENQGWSSDPPTCILECPTLSFTMDNGTLIGTGITNGSIVTYMYMCDPGYTLVGSETLACSDGLWNDTVPECLKDCSELPSTPDNGAANGTSLTHGSTVTYSCEQRFTLVGSETVTCSDGYWNDISPVCLQVPGTACTADPSVCATLVNGECSGTLGICFCLAGFTVDAGGCSYDCGTLTNPTNGAVDTAGGVVTGDTATYSCDSGYQRNGLATRQCFQDLGWDGTEPTCDQGQLGDDCSTNNLLCILIGSASCTANTCQCNTGYIADGAGSCTYECGGLNNPADGTVDTTAGTTTGFTATYDCNAGFKKTGSATTTCVADAGWDNPAPTCSAGVLNDDCSAKTNLCDNLAFAECDGATCVCSTNYANSGGTCIRDCGSAPTAPTNGGVRSTTFLEGDTVMYSCNTGFVMTGSATATCLADGTWDNTARVCNAAVLGHDCSVFTDMCTNLVFAECGGGVCVCSTNYADDSTGQCVRDCHNAPPTPPNGQVASTTFLEGNTITYSCDTGYVLVGLASASCQDDGTWDNLATTCRAAVLGDDCSVFTDMCTFLTFGECNTGAGQCACITNYADDGTGTCVRDCGTAPTAPTNGAVTGTAFLETNTVTYSCNTGFVMKGSATATCQTDGSWDNTATVCMAAVLGDDCSVFTDMCTFITFGECNTGSGQCACVTNYADDETGTCVRDCNQVPELQNGKLTLDSGSTTDGSTASVICDPGFMSSKDTITCLNTGTWENVICNNRASIDGPCYDASDCVSTGAVCMSNICSCKTGRYDSSSDVCDAFALYPYGPDTDTTILEGQSGCSSSIDVPQGIPIFDGIHTKLFICSNGIISMDQPYSNPIPPKNISSLQNHIVFAPYFADVNIANSGNIMYKEFSKYDSNKSIWLNVTQDIEHFIEQFDPTVDTFVANYILVVTWEERVSRFQNAGNATFQLVLATNGLDTFVFYIYGSKQMHWTTTALTTDIWIGYNAHTVYDNINSFKITALLIDANANTLDVIGVLVKKLTTNAKRKPNYALQCFEWYRQSVEGETEDIKTISARLPQCPCTLERLTFDPWFTSLGNSTFDSNVACTFMWAAHKFLPYGKTCCYDMTSEFWINEEPFAGGLLTFHPETNEQDNFLQDVHSRDVCCKKSNNCDLFYKRHPVGECYKETNFTFATFWGDPHFLTLDGKTFTFNGLGEYDLLKLDTEDVNFVLQGRTKQAVSENGTVTDATIFSAFAARDTDGESFHAELNETKNGFNVYANGADLTLGLREDTTKQYLEYHSSKRNLRVTRRNTTLNVLFTTSEIALNVSLGVKMFTLKVIVPTKYRNITRGLLGNFDGNPANDFITPDNGVLDATLAERDIYDYGQLWMIDPETSAFKYSLGKSHSDYRNTSFKPRFLDEAPPELLQKAEELCNGIVNQACVFDYVFTRDELVAEDSLDTNDTSYSNRDELGKRIPTLEPCEQVRVQLGSFVTCAVTVDSGSDLEFIFLNNDVNAIYNKSAGAIQYQQLDNNPANIRFMVKNEQGKYSGHVNLKQAFCSGCSKHGECTDSIEENHPKHSENTQFWKCSCSPEYEGLDCESDFDGCRSNPCSLGRQCTDNDVVQHKASSLAYVCGDCPDGYIDNGNKCDDIDECATNKGGCDQICINSDGSFTCSCNTGYRIVESDKASCKDINECDEALSNCAHVCVNVPGNYNCSCYKGFTYNDAEEICIIDKDIEHLCADTECPEKSVCIVQEDNNTTCSCDNGYQLEGTICKDFPSVPTCLSFCPVTVTFDLHFENDSCRHPYQTDVDECKQNVCPQDCYNVDGSFQCTCYFGYELTDRTTCAICQYPKWGEECQTDCICVDEGTLRCDHIRGCVCKDGWHGNTCAVDVNECDISHPCVDVILQCINTPGSYICECREGYSIQDDGTTCEDIDECSNPFWNYCEQTCRNTIGGYTCGCVTGFTKHNFTHCADIDECTLGQSGCEQLCENHPGLHSCYCQFGFKLNEDRKTCTKVSDPCAQYSNLTCAHVCVISAREARCECNVGFYLATDNETCIDVDECSFGTHKCSHNANCENTEGSYVCQCAIGSELQNDKRTCRECDEFHYGRGCSKSCNCIKGYCDKRKGCICDSGWTGKDCDKDVDECSTGVTICIQLNTACINYPGGYMCACRQGYNESLPGDCTDIDECTSPTSNVCDQTCHNTVGSYTCSCKTGFIMNEDRQCIDINECNGRHSCQQNCDNTIGSYRCSCEDGFKLDLTNRQQCKPIDVCTEEKQQNCTNNNADCFMAKNEPSCACRKGYIDIDADTESCQDIDECSTKTSPCSQTCNNTDGGYQCNCTNGFILQSDLNTCTECPQGFFGFNCSTPCMCNTLNTDVCDSVIGSCTCLKGWSGSTCNDDIDECSNESLYTCGEHTQCDNIKGSYICTCDIGYVNIGGGQCEECDGEHFGTNCKQNCTCEFENTEMCNKTDGRCTCLEGWTTDDCSEDVDECTNQSIICLHKNNSVCTNIQGSYSCVCSNGYYELNDQCQDTDECLTGDNDCDYSCVNTAGSYRCECSTGFTGTWNDCKECRDNTFGKNCSSACDCNIEHTMSASQSCDTVTGACICDVEWTGVTCDDDVNECTDPSICDDIQNTGCHNIVGGYRCDCLLTYTKDENGDCVSELESTTTRVAETKSVLNLKTTLDVTFPKGTDLTVKETRNEVEKDAKDSLSGYYSSNMDDSIEINIKNLSIGSLIVEYDVIFDINSDVGTNVLLAVVELSKGGTLIYKNHSVQAFTDASILGNCSTSDMCCIYSTLIGDCPIGSSCVVKYSKAYCKEDVPEDDFQQYIILGGSIGGGVVSILILIICIRMLRSQIQAKKNENTRRNNVVPDHHALDDGCEDNQSYSTNRDTLDTRDVHLTWKTMVSKMSKPKGNSPHRPICALPRPIIATHSPKYHFDDWWNSVYGNENRGTTTN